MNSLNVFILIGVKYWTFQLSHTCTLILLKFGQKKLVISEICTINKSVKSKNKHQKIVWHNHINHSPGVPGLVWLVWKG